MTKIVCDPIYTNDPAHCASNTKFRKIVEHLLATREDVFFYWLVPDWATDEDLAWYPQSDRIRLIKFKYSKDRIREYPRLTREYEELLYFSGELWDYDILITNRTSLVPLIKIIMQRRERQKLAFSKQVFLIEDMPIMTFKAKLYNPAFPDVQNLATLSGYLAADQVAISSFWEKAAILSSARKYLTPAQLLKISNTMIESSPLLFNGAQIKPTRAPVGVDYPFVVGYVGRLVSKSRPEEIFEVMEKHWVFRGGSGDKLKFVVSTQSKVHNYEDMDQSVEKKVGSVTVPSFVELLRLPREEFWTLCKSKMDVFVFMSKEEGYSMSLLEPLTLGVPAILIRADWSSALVGNDYPFFVDGFPQAYALIRAFYEKYNEMYAKFSQWVQNSFVKAMTARNGVYIATIFEQFLIASDKRYLEHKDSLSYLANNEVVLKLHEFGVANGGELVIPEAIKVLSKQKVFVQDLSVKFTSVFKESVALAWHEDWNKHRIGLMLHYGWRDAGIAVGHMKRGLNDG